MTINFFIPGIPILLPPFPNNLQSFKNTHTDLPPPATILPFNVFKVLTFTLLKQTIKLNNWDSLIHISSKYIFIFFKKGGNYYTLDSLFHSFQDYTELYNLNVSLIFERSILKMSLNNP